MNLDADNFGLFLFTTNPVLAAECLRAGVNGIIIDWENKEKNNRQSGYPTQINYDTVEDLSVMRNAIQDKIICRLNKFNTEYSKSEIDDAINNGADEVFFPMVENKEEVMRAIDLVRDRCKVAILIETDAAARNAESFANLPLSRVYIGLNDLHISRKSSNIFEPLTDNTVKIIKDVFTDIPVGVGGITHPERGFPVPSHLLIKQYINLRINFSFLRRSFLKDIKELGAEKTISDIRDAIKTASSNTSGYVESLNNSLKPFMQKLIHE